MTARSFTAPLEVLGKTLSDTLRAVPSATGGIVFVSGSIAREAPKLARSLRQLWRGIPALVVPAQGVLSERGEIEGAASASGIVWSGAKTFPFATPEATPTTELDSALFDAIASASGARAGAVLLFPKPEVFQPSLLEAAERAAPRARTFGGGTPGPSAVVLTASGEIIEGSIAGLCITGLAAPLVDTSPACRLLSEPFSIDEMHAGSIFTLSGQPALDRLSTATKGLSEPGGPSLVLLALEEDAKDDDGRPRFIIRPVRGVDPARRALLIGGGARLGQKLAFAMRDAATSKSDLDTMARRVSKQTLGAAPRFALYFSCAGRGQGLYGAPDVESRILKKRFGDLPIAGMHSSFEIAPLGSGPSRMHLYTGVLGLFRSPS